MTTYTIASIQTFLKQLTPFDRLPPFVLSELALKLRPLRYRMGQTILLKDKMPKTIAIVYEGQARLLGYHPSTQMPLTLKLAEPGEILGWVGLVRNVPCETAIASTESICLTLESSDFLDLIRQNSEFCQYFQNVATVTEIFDLFTHLSIPLSWIEDWKTWIYALSDRAEICSIPPGNTSRTHPIATPLSQPETRWFISGGGSLKNGTVGEMLPLDLPNLEVRGNLPLRLVGVPESFVNPPPVATVEEGEGKIIRTSKILNPPTPIPQPPSLPIPYAPDTPEGEAVPKTARRGKYPFLRGDGVIDSAVACFQMLGLYFKAPFRREVIRRVVGEAIQRQGSLSLYHCGAIAELMGLTGQLVTVPASALPRLQTPALLHWQDSLAILYEANETQLIIAVSDVGLLRRKPKDFSENWGESGQVLLLQATKETPQQRFGIGWFLPSVWKYRGVLIEVLFSSFLVQLFGLVNPLVIQLIIDQVIVKKSEDTLQVLGVLLLGVAILEAILSTLRTYLFVDTTNRIDLSLGSEIIDHLLRLPLRYFDKRPVGELSSRINELENIRSFLTGTALTVVLDAIFSVIYIVVMVVYSWQLTLVALGTIPLFIFFTWILASTIRTQLRIKAERNADTQAHLVEVLSGIQTVKAQNIELRSRWAWQERYSRYISAGFNTVMTSTLGQSTRDFLNKISGLLVLWYGAYLVLNNDLTLGQLIAFRIIAGYVTTPILRLTQLYQNFQETALSLERLGDIVDTPQEGEQDRMNIPLPPLVGTVKYENVNFRFKPNSPLQLVNVNLEIKPGQFVGVVGKSGAGKSTLTKLLVRLYDVESGRILIDGYDIAKVELYSLRRQIGVVPQEPLLFDGTVQENIGINNPDASSEEIINAAKIAAAHEFIMELPNGYNTRVGERGAGLSGGQRQRIAIARTVLQRPEMLILDEATSALDYPTEHQVFTNLMREFGSQTAFFITHRLATIKTADVIIMMDAGAVVEQGTHEELMSLKGRYAALYQQQGTGNN